jgi:hypothetical protein
MARSSRSARPLIDSVQAHLALPHGAVSWHAFPLPVREQVVALWIELLRRHVDAPSEEVSS